MFVKELLLVGVLTSLCLTVVLFLNSSVQQEERRTHSLATRRDVRVKQRESERVSERVREWEQGLPQLRGSLLDYHHHYTLQQQKQQQRGGDNHSLTDTLSSTVTVQFNSSSLLKHELYHATLEQEKLAVPLAHSLPVEYFTCVDGSNARAVLNDDYCDCEDGSDENVTSACSGVVPRDRSVFQCTTKELYQHYPTHVYLSRVNDGVCDCADGSDEYDSALTLCRNHVAMRNMFLPF